MVRSVLALGIVLLASVAAAACGSSSKEPASPGPFAAPPSAAASPEPASSAASSASSETPADAAEPASGGRKRKPFEIHSSCPDVATVLFGEDPKAAGAGRRTVASNSSIDGPRDEQGKQTVWLLDAKGEALVNVHVTRGMKRLEIGRSCRTLDAR